MKRLRTPLALLLQLLLLQVSVLGGGMACAPEWLGVVMSASHPATHPASHVGSHVGSHAAHGGAGHGTTARSEAPAHHGAPAHDGVPAHCAAAAGCAAVTVEAPTVAVAPVTIVHGEVRSGRVSLPRSTHPAPEPPPPRG